MGYFPFYMELEGQTGLVAGGGNTALGKVKKLLDFGPELVVIAPEVLPELAALPGVAVRKKRFEKSDLDPGAAFVIAATDDFTVNREIAALCRERKLPVNVVDAPADCSFFFPALVKRGPLCIGISTGGASPAAAKYLKREIERLLPDALEGIIMWLGSQRTRLLKEVKDPALRKKTFEALLSECLRLERPLEADEMELVLRRSGGADG